MSDGASPNEFANKVTVSQVSGYVFLAGRATSTISFPATSGSIAVNNAGTYSGFMFCFDNDLTALWGWSMRVASGTAEVISIAIDDANQFVYAVGYFNSASAVVYNHLDAPAGLTCATSGSDDIFILRFHSLTGAYQTMYCNGKVEV